MEVLENKVLVFNTRTPAKYTNAIRKVEVLGQRNGLTKLAVFWGLDEVRVLRNLGLEQTPSPILGRYNWPAPPSITPFEHQKDTAAFLTFHPRAFVFNEAGTGKTMAAGWCADYLMRIGAVRRVLVVCPLSIMNSAWLDDLNKTLVHRSVGIAHHTNVEKRREVIRNDYDFVIINHDGIGLVGKDIVEDGRFDLIIVDECNAFKNSQTKRWASLKKLIQPHTRLWMMTGTPAAQSPVDAYGIAKLVSPDRVPKYYNAWRDKVMIKITQFKWLPRANAKDIVHDALQPAVRYTKDMCLDLPPVMTEVRTVPLTAQQQKYYDMLRNRMMMEASGATITAVNAAAGVNKLLQISAGAAYTDDREVVEFDCTPRLNVLLEAIEETQRKVLVFVPYRHAMVTIENFLKKNGVECAQIHGGVTLTTRTLLFKKLQNPDDPLKVLVIEPHTASHGVTLTQADTVVFWGPVTSVETYIQCVARSDRHGQTSEKVTVVCLQGSSIEKRMYTVLFSRIEDHAAVVNLYREELQLSP